MTMTNDNKFMAQININLVDRDICSYRLIFVNVLAIGPDICLEESAFSGHFAVHPDIQKA